jgi:hypothetical protein
VAAIILFSSGVEGSDEANPDQCDGGSELSSIQLVNEQFSHLAQVVRDSTYNGLLPEDFGKLVIDV